MVDQVRSMEFGIPINFLSTATLDRLYVLVLPDGGLYVPSGPDYHYFGPLLSIDNLDTLLRATNFDSIKHLRHSRAWGKAIPLAR